MLVLVVTQEARDKAARQKSEKDRKVAMALRQQNDQA